MCPDPQQQASLVVSDLIQTARSWLGVPYLHLGRSRRGVDCAGLVVMAFKELGIEIADRAVYSRQPFRNELENHTALSFRRVETGEPGDIFLMSFAGRPTSHVGIFTGRTIIHSYLTVGRVVENDFIDGRPAKLKKIYRWNQ